MKSITGVIIGAVLVILVIIGVVYYENHKTVSVAPESASGGSVYVGVTDATADIADVNDITMSMQKVEIHSEASGWMTLASNPKDYQLLSLNASGQTQLYVRADNVAPGSYDKVRITLGDTIVNTKSSGDMDATMPSSQVVMNTDLNVTAGETSNFKMDFNGSESLHKTSDDQYVFAPVVNTEATSNATVAVAPDNSMTVTGGTVDATGSVGVDLDGSSKANFVLSTDSTFKVDSNFGGQLNFILGGKSYQSDTNTVQEDETTGTTTSGTTSATINTNTNATSNTTPNTGTTINGVTGINTNLTY